MSIVNNGIFGHQKGRLRNLVFYTRNGKNVCRTIGIYVDNPSPGQTANRNGLSVTMTVVQALHGMVKLGFDIEARGTVRSAFNLAVSYNKKYALTGQGDDIKVDYTKVMLSKGVLPVAQQVVISNVKGGILVKWDGEIDKHAHGNDMAMIALYYPGSKGASTHLNATRRDNGEIFIPVAKIRQNEPAEVYMFFRSINGERVSDSQYLGNLNGKVMTKEELVQYEIAVLALAKSRAGYANEQEKFSNTGKKTRNYKNLEKECRVWESRIFNLSGRPG